MNLLTYLLAKEGTENKQQRRQALQTVSDSIVCAPCSRLTVKTTGAQNAAESGVTPRPYIISRIARSS